MIDQIRCKQLDLTQVSMCEFKGYFQRVQDIHGDHRGVTGFVKFERDQS